MRVEEFKKWLEQAVVNSDVVKIFENLLTVAVEMGASDIHLEPLEHFGRVRVRVDGVLEELIQYPRSLQDSIVSKFKIESGQMRPDEKRMPQDARVSNTTLTNKEIDLRANTLPTVWGEKLVMRVVDKSKTIPKFQELGIVGRNRDIVEARIRDPNGIILATGPTGSGKTTTLYSFLQEINVDSVNIVTYEDPVENKILGLNQAQIRSDIGFSFASGLRGGLRQDPDIMMVGEIRDKETLTMAMEAAMTGHLVFSTVHTNSAVETITRVVNLGAQAYMITGTFNLVIAQRLVRRMNPETRIKMSVKDSQFRNFAVEVIRAMPQDALVSEMAARGISQEVLREFVEEWVARVPGIATESGLVPAPVGQGMRGRAWLFEIMEYTDEIKNLLLAGESAFAVGKFAMDQGMLDLERDGVLKVVAGEIALEELYRVVRHRPTENSVKISSQKSGETSQKNWENFGENPRAENLPQNFEKNILSGEFSNLVENSSETVGSKNENFSEKTFEKTAENLEISGENFEKKSEKNSENLWNSREDGEVGRGENSSEDWVK